MPACLCSCRHQLPEQLLAQATTYMEAIAGFIAGSGDTTWPRPGHAPLPLDHGTIVYMLNDLGSTIAQCRHQQSGRRKADAVPKQLQALRALAVLTRVLGASIVNYTPQIMAVLSDALLHLEAPELQLQALAGWHVFVKQLASRGSHMLQRVAAQAAVVLLPVLEQQGEAMQAAVQILEELLIKNASHMGAAFARMPPLPSIPALASVNQALAVQQRLSGPADRLQLLVRSMRHESLNVRHAALTQLKAFMASRAGSGYLAALVSEAVSEQGGLGAGGGGAAPGARGGAAADARALVSDLTSALLRCCDNAARTRLAMSLKQMCAQCLGLLGAVDPGRLHVSLPKPEPLESGPDQEQQFLLKLMTKHLVRRWAHSRRLRQAPAHVVVGHAPGAALRTAACHCCRPPRHMAPHGPHGPDVAPHPCMWWWCHPMQLLCA
jgi:hypothetical protein